MPLGIVSDEEFTKEIEAIHKPIIRGRGETKETPEVIREVIAEEAIIGDSTQKEIADAFGVSPASVSAYKNGATSTASYNEPDNRLQKHNDKVRNAIVGTARSRLIEALQNITPDKMKEAKLRDIASVAKDMSSVIHNMEPQISNTQIGAQFVFHVPKPRQESDYEVIDVVQ
jgi:predicted transcriptional regulator